MTPFLIGLNIGLGVIAGLALGVALAWLIIRHAYRTFLEGPAS